MEDNIRPEVDSRRSQCIIVETMEAHKNVVANYEAICPHN
jgi:hypothetical protein